MTIRLLNPFKKELIIENILNTQSDQEDIPIIDDHQIIKLAMEKICREANLDYFKVYIFNYMEPKCCLGDLGSLWLDSYTINLSESKIIFMLEKHNGEIVCNIQNANDLLLAIQGKKHDR